MDDNPDKINIIKKALSNSEKKITDLDKEIKNLSDQKAMLEENEKLRQTHKQNQLKISEHKNKLYDLDYQIKINYKRISEIKEKNRKLQSGSIINEVEVQNINNKNDEIIKKIKEINPKCIVIKKSEVIQLNNEIFQDNELNDYNEEENIINNGNEEDEEIKNKLFNLIQDKEEAEQIYKKYGKEQICHLFNFDFKNDNKKEKKEILKEDNNKNINSKLNNINNNGNNNSSVIEENYIKKLQYQ